MSATAKQGKMGQMWTVDFLFMGVIIAILFLFFVLGWNYIGIRWLETEEYNAMWFSGVIAAEHLVISEGQPKGWENINQLNASNLKTIGLINYRNELDNDKLNKMLNLSLENYSLMKDKLGLRRYELFINLTNLNRTAVYYQIGRKGGELNESVVFDRLVLYNETPAVMKVEVWK